LFNLTIQCNKKKRQLDGVKDQIKAQNVDLNEKEVKKIKLQHDLDKIRSDFRNT